MNSRYSQNIKKYHGYSKNQKYGVMCSINSPIDAYPLHRHDYIEIEYIVSGKIIHEINGYKKTVTAGECWCLNTYDTHKITVLEPVEIHNICIDLKASPEAVHQFINSLHLSISGKLNIKDLQNVKNLFKKLYNSVADENIYSKEKITAYLLLILTTIAKNSTKISKAAVLGGYSHISKAIDYISQNYYEDITLNKVAKEVFLSPNYFSKLFFDISGYNFSDYLSHIRVDKAKEFLKNTNMPITYISTVCGFGSFATFSRTFKKIVGCSASKYREKIT